MTEDRATWREMLREEMEATGDGGPIIHVAPSESVLDIEFDDGYGSPEGRPFLAWSASRVYFPACHEGSEWVASVPRNPTSEGQRHVGGG